MKMEKVPENLAHCENVFSFAANLNATSTNLLFGKNQSRTHLACENVEEVADGNKSHELLRESQPDSFNNPLIQDAIKHSSLLPFDLGSHRSNSIPVSQQLLL